MEANSTGAVPGGGAQAERDEQARAERAAEEAKVTQAALRITGEVAKARGLEVRGEFGVELIGREGVRTFVKDAMYDQYTKEEIQMLGRIDASFGVLPVGSDPEQVLLDMYEDGVLGIYDPEKKVLLIGDFVGRTQLGMVIGHEGAHGLQDMHFDLTRLQEVKRGRSDHDSAITFLVEGDAQAAYLAYVSGSQGLEAIGDDVLQAQADMVLGISEAIFPNATLARQMQMPYTDGTMNVVKLARSEGWAAVDALYKDLPQSTEQMLHLDKRTELPLELKIDAAKIDAAAPGHEVIWEDELGEATLLALLADVAEPDRARSAAAGWGGDRYIALDIKTAPGPAPLVIGVIAWDSESDAKQFEPVFREYLEKHKPDDHLLVRKRSRVLYATHISSALPSLTPGEPEAKSSKQRTKQLRDLANAAFAAFSIFEPATPSKAAN